MGLLDKFFSTSEKATSGVKTNRNIFNFLFGTSAPEMKASDYLDAYTGWVFSCVNAISEQVATMDLRLQQNTNDGWVDMRRHIAQDTLFNVNPFMTSSELIYQTSAYLLLEGNAFWYMPRGSATRKPAEIWILDPSRTYVIKSLTDVVGGYVYRNEKNEDVPIAREEILHFKRFHPRNRYRGMGVVQASAVAIDTDVYASKYNRNFFFNSAMPSATLETEGTLTPEQLERIKSQWDARYSGTDNAHKLAILQGGLHFNPIAVSQKDMQFLETRKFSRDEILAIFRVPKSMLGVVEDVNRANAEATEYMFSRYVVKPQMEFIADRLTEFYLPMFGLSQTQYRFGFTDPTPENKELALREYETGIRNGYLMPNEVRSLLGMESAVGGDTLYLPTGFSPVTGSTENTEDEVKSIKKKEVLIPLVKSTEPANAKRVKWILNFSEKQAPKFRDVISEQKTKVLDAIATTKSAKRIRVKKSDEETFLQVVLSEFGDDFVDSIREVEEETLTVPYERAGSEVLGTMKLDATFDLKHERAVQWLNENALKLATQVNESFKDEMRRILVAGLNDGLSIDDMSDQIATFYDNQTEWRALRIARTETVRAYAEGSMEGYRQTGIVRMKRWLTAGDGDVESECKLNEADGAIGINASFSSGHQAPPVHPNCRCTIVPVVD